MRRAKEAVCLVLVIMMMLTTMMAATACGSGGDAGKQNASDESQLEQNTQETTGGEPDGDLTESVQATNEGPDAGDAIADGSGSAGNGSGTSGADPGSQTAQNTGTDADDGQTMTISGSGVEKTVTLSLSDLKSMKDAYYEDDYFALNSYGTKAYFSFRGVKLAAVLEKAGLKSSARTITFVAPDGYEQQLTVEQALKTDYIDEQNPDKKYPVIIAWHENGEDYDPAEGLPFRLVVGQKAPGDANKPQWVSNIKKVIVE